MSKLTDAKKLEIAMHFGLCRWKQPPEGEPYVFWHADRVTAAFDAIESAATAPLLQRIAELERKSDQDDETILWQAKEISEKTDKLAELERQLEEARNQALEEAANAVDAMKAPDGYNIQEKSLYDVATMEAADAIRALKGAKE